jgi:hypothetical protein
VPHRDPAGWLKERLGGLRQAKPSAEGPVAGPAAVVRTAVVTDSAAALPADWVRAVSADGRLTVVPMPVMVGAEIYGEGEDDIAETIALALASGRPSRPRLHPDSLNRRIWRPSAAALSPSCRSTFPGSCPERWTPPGSPPPA